VSDVSGESGESPPRASIGEYLARQRKLRGISVDELCEITRIPRRNIERLESGALDGVHDGFVRGFVRTVAQALGMDADEAVMRLMQEPAPEPAPERGWLSLEQLRWLGVAALFLVAVLLFMAGRAWWSQRDEVEAPPQVLRRHDAIGELVREQADPERRAAGDASAEAAPPSSE
jgi:cytoskeletal protein RodZ